MKKPDSEVEESDRQRIRPKELETAGQIRKEGNERL